MGFNPFKAVGNLLGGGSKPQTPGATEQERALAERSAGEWTDFKKRILPIEDKLVAKLRDTQPAIDRIASGISLKTALAAKDANPVGQAAASGVGGNSSRAVFGISDVGDAVASGRAKGTTEAINSVNQRKRSGLLKVSTLGRGLADDSSVSLANAGRRSTDKAIFDMNDKLQRQQQFWNAIGTGVGMYTSASGGKDKSGGGGSGKAPTFNWGAENETGGWHDSWGFND